MEPKLPLIEALVDEMMKSGYNNLSAITNQVQREFNLSKETARKAVLDILSKL